MGIELKNREGLAAYFAEQRFVRGAEVGVAKGTFSAELLRVNPLLHLISVDSWRRRPSERLLAEACLQPYIDLGRCQILQMSSVTAAKAIPDGSLDFVFIDANHKYEAVLEDLTHWTPKVRPGGIVSGHDYFEGTYDRDLGVIPAVNDYVRMYSYELQVIGWDKQNPLKDSRQPCWWFRR